MKKDGLTRLYRLAAAFVTAFALVLLTGPAFSADAQKGGCDPVYMQSLRGRAELEAKREVANNKNLIYKEDSVLEYSCIFSHFTNLETRTFMGIDKDAMKVVSYDPIFNFLANSFGHSYLGGRYETGSASLPSGAYFCDAQFKMWEFAKCINMHQYTDAESFFDFNWFINNDPRTYPKDYAKCTNIAQDIDLKSAFRGLQDTWLIKQDVRPDNKEYGVDPINTYLPLMRWDVPGGDTCGDPIPTGLSVIRRDGTFPEQICAKPGCTLICQDCGVKDKTGKWVCLKT